MKRSRYSPGVASQEPPPWASDDYAIQHLENMINRYAWLVCEALQFDSIEALIEWGKKTVDELSDLKKQKGAEYMEKWYYD